MIITAIVLQKRKKDRVNIFLDDKFAFSLPLELSIKHKLKVDQSINQNKVNQLVKESELDVWYNKTLNLLSFRPRSKNEVITYLNKKKVGDITQTLVLKKLEKNKLINDYEFAKWFINQRKTFRPRGKRMLWQELRQKGVQQNIVEKIVNKLMTGDEELELARKVIEKKLRIWKNLDKKQQKQKIHHLLLRRGFDWGTIKKLWVI